MKNPLRNLLVPLCLLLALLSSFNVKAQQTLTQIDGWNAYVHLPASYSNTNNSYPTIIFFPGIGEVGTNPATVISYGPGAFINQGWNGNAAINGNTVEFIVISLQPPAGYPNEVAINQKIQTIKSLYRVDNNKLYLTGLSQGGWCSTTFVTGDPYGGPYTYASQIAAVVEVEGLVPDDNAPYPDLFDNYAKVGGRLLGFEQALDNRGMPTRVNRMNATKPGSAIYVQTNFGGGGHCCWSQFYGGEGSQPGIFMLDGINQNLYEWLARQSLGNTVPLPPVNVIPVANAGSDQAITLPINTITLNGSGTDADGSIVSYLWTKISGPATGTITNATSASTTLTGLSEGTYTFQLQVTDNSGATSTDNIVITVNALIQSLVPPPATNSSTVSTPCNTNAPVTYTITQTGPGEIYRPKSSLWKGGDTLKITGTYYSVIEFDSIGGDACRPLVIMPMTTLETPVFRFKGNCSYIKLWGGKTKYGIKVNGGALAISNCNHIEADNVECTGGSIGVYCKQDVVYADQTTWNPNYRMTKFAFKNMWIHDVNGEGFYVGITQPSGLTVKSTYSGLDTVIVPIRLDSVEISNNLVERTTWDGIQLSNARNGNKIFNNTVRNYGTLNISSQQAGIILGGNCNGDIYNNTIIKGTGNGIEAFGYGVTNIYGNTLDSCGYDGNTNSNGTEGQQSIYASDYINGIEVNPKQTINVYGNTINHPKTSGAIFITGYYNNSLPSSVYNNTFCIPNAAANWQNTFLKLNVAGSSNTNNILSCSGVTNKAPVASAGPDIAITLPTSSVTLTGSGTDADGSINGYAWVKISGPAQGTIVSANAAATAINNLIQGIYLYELTVTDNNGAIGKDTIQVTVNAQTTISLLPAVNPANTVNGLDYKYYEGDWTGVPAFSSLTPVKSGTTANFDISLANRSTGYGFSFTGFINVPADGQYTFYTSSDDGSNLYIDNVLTVSNDGLHGNTEKSGVIGLKAGKHAITGLYFQQSYDQVFLVSYEGAGISKQAIPSSALYRVSADLLPAVNPANTVNGLDYKYYEGNWNVIPAFPSLNPVKTGSTGNFDISLANRSTQYGFSFTGFINVPADGQYTFYTSSDDGSSLYIDNVLTVTNDGLHDATEKSGVIGLKAGKHAITVLFFQQTGGQVLQVSYEGMGISKQALPASALYRVSIGNLLPAVYPANIVNGLDYKYYEGNWTGVSAFASLNPVKTGTTNNFDISLANRTTQYGLSFTGFINVPADGQYTFYTTSDDGSNLYIDNVLTVSNDGLHGATEKSGVIGLQAGKHAITGLYFQQGWDQVFQVSYEGAGITKQAIPPTALYRSTNIPEAIAGPSQTIIIPTSTVVLSGSGSVTDGNITTYQWTQISGAVGSSFTSASSAVTKVNGLVQGNYQFQLKITDNSGNTASSVTQVTVINAARIMRVNIFGGSNPYNDPKWNNWNLYAGVTSGNFLYEDLTISPVNASLSGDVLVVDNGSDYASSTTVTSPGVLRYNSSATSQRTLSVKGLDPAKKYSFEFYASRANTGNQTVFAIGNKKDTVNTDNNINDYAQFVDIIPDNSGQVQVNISRVGVWNYIAGFSIIEQATTALSKSSAPLVSTTTIDKTQSVYPNPFHSSFKVQINDMAAGNYTLLLSDISGKRILAKKVNKTIGVGIETIQVNNLPIGTYLLEIKGPHGSSTTQKLIKN